MAKKLVKIAVDKNDWLTFGISDKKYYYAFLEQDGGDMAGI